jgi:hypothetical protein
VEWPPPTFSTDSGFSSSCRCRANLGWLTKELGRPVGPFAHLA